MGLDFSHCSAQTDFSGRNSRRRFAQAVFKGHLHISGTEEYTTHIALTLPHTRMCVLLTLLILSQYFKLTTYIIHYVLE